MTLDEGEDVTVVFDVLHDTEGAEGEEEVEEEEEEEEVQSGRGKSE